MGRGWRGMSLAAQQGRCGDQTPGFLATGSGRAGSRWACVELSLNLGDLRPALS